MDLIYLFFFFYYFTKVRALLTHQHYWPIKTYRYKSVDIC